MAMLSNSSFLEGGLHGNDVSILILIGTVSLPVPVLLCQKNEVMMILDVLERWGYRVI